MRNLKKKVSLIPRPDPEDLGTGSANVENGEEEEPSRAGGSSGVSMNEDGLKISRRQQNQDFNSCFSACFAASGIV